MNRWLLPPPASDGAVARLRWVRRVEIVSGVLALIGAAAAWSSAGAFRWLLLGSGLLALSPWPGPGRLARRAEQRGDVALPDVAERRRRANAFLRVLIPCMTLMAAAVGYVMLGVAGAIVMSTMSLLSGAFGVWAYRRIERE